MEASGSCNGKTPCFANIQQAINSAAEGATIRVAEGRYHENLVISGSKKLVLEGGWDNNFLHRAPDANLTVIDGDINGDGIGDGGVVRIEALSGLTITLDINGFTIQNGVSEDGGGIFAMAHTSAIVILNLDGNIIRYNNSPNTAGGIGVYAQDPGANVQSTLTNNILYGNRTVGNGGAMLAASSNSINLSVTIINNTVSENFADAAGDGLSVIWLHPPCYWKHPSMSRGSTELAIAPPTGLLWEKPPAEEEWIVTTKHAVR